VKRAGAAVVAVAAVLFAANMLGVAVAEAPTTTTLRTVSVQGVATLPIGQFDNGTEADAVYREAQASAVGDGQAKASFLAAKVSSTAATVQSVIEGGGYISCRGGEENDYAEYDGVEPDFGTAPQPNAETPVAGTSPEKQSSSPAAHRLTPKHPKTKHKSPTAKKAATITCTVTAQVSLIYAIS
jgi:hypothetical protein